VTCRVAVGSRSSWRERRRVMIASLSWFRLPFPWRRAPKRPSRAVCDSLRQYSYFILFFDSVIPSCHPVPPNFDFVFQEHSVAGSLGEIARGEYREDYRAGGHRSSVADLHQSLEQFYQVHSEAPKDKSIDNTTRTMARTARRTCERSHVCSVHVYSACVFMYVYTYLPQHCFL